MRKIQRIRGLATTPKTVTEYADYTGHRGELVSVFDENGKVVEPFLVVHDGVTKGGWKYDNLQVPGGETEGTADTGSLPTQPPSAQGISSGWLKDSALIDYSAYFDGSSRLSKNFAQGDQQTFTWSGWFKRSLADSSTACYCLFASYQGNGGGLSDNDNGWLMMSFYQDTLLVNGWGSHWRKTSAKYSDTSAWNHVVLSVDSNNADDFDRMRLYVNGDRILADELQSNLLIPKEFEFPVNYGGANGHGIGDIIGYTDNYYFHGHMANIHFIDGAALDESYFGETVEGNWIRRPYDGTSTVEGATTVSGLGGTNDKYGTNGFHLNFADESNLGKDVSGNGNDWT